VRYIKIPIQYDKKTLHQIYDENKNNVKVYVNKKGNNQPIGILSFKNKPNYLLEIENKFNFVHNSYFLISGGYHPHKDDSRQCIISFEVLNIHKVPLKFYDPEEEIYHDNPIMWNTQELHGSENSPSDRIFYQVELKDDQSFQYYVNQYHENNLLK
jgi:hypothetical protein